MNVGATMAVFVLQTKNVQEKPTGMTASSTLVSKIVEIVVHLGICWHMEDSIATS